MQQSGSEGPGQEGAAGRDTVAMERATDGLMGVQMPEGVRLVCGYAVNCIPIIPPQ